LPQQSKNSMIVKNYKLRHVGLLVCFTNAAAKEIFCFNMTFLGQDVPRIKTYLALGCPQYQVSHVRLSGINSVASSYPASGI